MIIYCFNKYQQNKFQLTDEFNKARKQLRIGAANESALRRLDSFNKSTSKHAPPRVRNF